MKTLKILGCFALILLSSGTALAGFIPLRDDVPGERPVIRTILNDQNQIQIEVRLPGIERLEGLLDGRRWDRIEIPGGGFELDLGAPEVPHFTRLLAIPPTTGFRTEFEALEISTLSNIELMPAQGIDPEDLTRNPGPVHFDMAAYSTDAFYPVEKVMLGEPALMRGLRVLPLRMNPVRYNPVTKELQIVHRFRVNVFFEGLDLRNIPVREIPLSRSWAASMQNTLINFNQRDLDPEVMGSYLIVCENDNYLVNALLLPLMDWKNRKGHTVALETFTPGASSTAIKNIIQTAYDTWEIPPEYVLLFGDVTGYYALPGFQVGAAFQTDHPYSQLDGEDILPDVAIGRIPADDDYEAVVMINKILYYEKMPYTTSDDWYHQSCLVAGSAYSGISTVFTNRWIKTRMLWNEYTRIDTFWYWMGGSSVNTTIVNAINDGVTYCNYRGWLGMEGFGHSSINNLINGRMLPFVTLITCNTGGFSGPESYVEHFVREGTPMTPKGAIAGIGGITSSQHTRYNNAIDIGIYAGIFEEGLTQPGHALNRGKLEVYNAYWLNDPGATTNWFNWYMLGGDPGLDLFTGPIQYMTCSIPDSLLWGENTLSLTVNETGVGPLQDAAVCLYKEGALHEVALTDAIGQVTLPLNAQSPGNVKVTITKQNFYPIVDSLNVTQADVVVGYHDHAIDDDDSGTSSGDGDGIINPGETVEIPLVFKNFGSTITASGISVTAAESDEYATLDDGYETFPDLPPGAAGNSIDDFDLAIALNCPHGHSVRLDLITNSDQGSWDGILDLEVVSYDMTILSAYTSGSDTLLSPGETANFILALNNEGGKDAASLIAAITSLDPSVTVNDDSAGFGTINAGTRGDCHADPFNLTAADEAPPGCPVNLVVTFVSSTGASQTDTITITLGGTTTYDPQGPDEYGYYCFDDTDMNYLQTPVFEWIEIDPNYGGSGIELHIVDPAENEDMSVNVSLPFTFRYYGEDVDEITVCSNGWISTWPNVAFANFRNFPIPSSMGPNGLIAAFWDDLVTWSGGHVYALYDAADHRFIIEWSRMKNLGSPQPLETFEIILYDPDFYPTTTGDGEILFQYHNITEVFGHYDDNPYSTVGIERPDKQDGIEVVYWNTYTDPAAAELQNRRAYLFTTNFEYTPPVSGLQVRLSPYGTPVIPASGGSFDFNIEVENSGAGTVVCDLWSDVTLPDSIIFGPVLDPVNLTLPSGFLGDRDRTQYVPGNAPAGSYVYNGYVGLYPDVIWDQDSFTFEKLPAGAGDWIDDWQNTGEPFEEWFAETGAETPAGFQLLGLHPNPFNPSTTISFTLPEAAAVNLSIYDVSGRRAITLIDGWRDPGFHNVTFDASNLASGIYIYRLTAGKFTASGKMVLLK
jgi:hypothetical protein